MSKTGNLHASAQIMDYLKIQNRPYSAIDIFNNLHKEHGKTAIVKALEQLVSENKIKEKTYGKQKIYFYNQDEFSSSENIDLQQMDTEIANMVHTLKEIQQQVKSSECVLLNLQKSLTTEEVNKQLASVSQEIPVLQTKLQTLLSNTSGIGPEEKKTLYQSKTKYCKEWRRRKRLANDMMDAILEGYPKDKKHLMEEVGLEADGDLNVFDV